MTDVNKVIEEFKEIARHPARSVELAIQKTGKKAVGCFPIYSPDELVYAAGALPIGMWGGPQVGNLSDRYYQVFCCSVIKANTHQALKGVYDKLSAVLVSAFCDTLKCTIENWKVAVPHLNIIPVVYSQNRKTSAGKIFMREEFARVKRELEKVLGVTVTDEALEKSYALYEEYRSLMREFVAAAGDYPEIFDASTRHLIIKAAYFMDKAEYVENMKLLLEGLKEIPRKENTYKRIIISGLLAEPEEFLNLFSENNLVIVADDLAQESRQFRVRVPQEGDVFERMAERVARQDGCPFLYDKEKTRGKMLIDLKKQFNADGIVYCQLKFCDPEEFDYPVIKKELEEAGVPALYIEIEQQMDSVEQLRTRIQTFSEIL